MTRKNDMTQEENNPLIPKLRFPEFRNAGGWRTVQLSEVLDYERPDRYIVNDTNYVNDGIPVLTANKSFVIGYTRETENVYTDVPVVIFDDFTTDKKLVTFAFKVKSSAIKILKAKKGDNLRLLYELMAQIKFDAQEHKRYYISEYQYIKIPLPEINEQKKVAECLSTLDELIEVESRKLDALKDHKTGLMQQLFPREGETRPRLRFPEFCNAPEWTARRLGDACSLQAGMFVRASEIKDQYEVGLYPCYGGNGLRGYTATFTHDGAFPLVGRQGALCGNVKFCTGKFHATEHALVATPKTGIDVKWLYYALDFLNLNRFATGQAQPGLSVDVLEKVHFSAPDKVDEQHRIAACLSSLDDLIAAQSEKLKALRTHKRGLMQQLFPNPSGFES